MSKNAVKCISPGTGTWWNEAKIWRFSTAPAIPLLFRATLNCLLLTGASVPNTCRYEGNGTRYHGEG